MIDMSRNIGLRHLPHGDEWTNEVRPPPRASARCSAHRPRPWQIAMRKEQYGNLVEQLNAVKSQYDEIKKAMPASGGSPALQSLTAARARAR